MWQDADPDGSALKDALLNDFAIRSFRDVADDDYIAARMAHRAQLVVPYLWASQQATEKYLKCILLLHRIPAPRIKHDLSAGLAKVSESGKLTLGLTKGTEKFIDYLDTYGRFRYLEVPHHAFGHDLVKLDRAVWELRRFCTLSIEPRQRTLREGFTPPKVRLAAGRLEKIIDKPKDPAREPLLWQNAFFGPRVRRKVKLGGWLRAANSPLSLHPQILDEVLKYVFLPTEVVKAYRSATPETSEDAETAPADQRSNR
jgi:hypothetical protein